jgi:UPF0755 protein
MNKWILKIAPPLLLLAGMTVYLLFGSMTIFSNEKKYLYVKPGDARQQILEQISEGEWLKRTGIWQQTMQVTNSWSRITPGRFEIRKGMSLYQLILLFRHNEQSAVKLVINKLRQPQDLAKIVSKNFMVDSLSMLEFLTNSDSLSSLNLHRDNWMTAIIPNTYQFNWTTSPRGILSRLQKETAKFWKQNNRYEQAAAMGLEPAQVYTLASIVEEETNKHDEKGNIASVYINRLDKGMALGADPTIKFALKDFSIKRILFKHLEVNSPYNTYRHTGLPPGPICTPQVVSIDAVLQAPRTDYIFFVARSDFSGYHTFTTNFTDHSRYAREYQDSLNAYLIRKNKQKP